ncbi:excisionase family protein, partial [Escherichia coli]|uniref:excisionase family protein n=1 Tax=Escherichia coli TaxID=562 RepID=UPI003F4AF048
DRNRSHWSTSKTPSYTKSVSWQHHLKGIKKGTLKKAREKSFMEGREYKHVAHDGMPWDNSPCFYNLEEIDRWIERQASARPRRHLT